MQAYADENSLFFWETSAKTNVNVAEVINDIAERRGARAAANRRYHAHRARPGAEEEVVLLQHSLRRRIASSAFCQAGALALPLLGALVLWEVAGHICIV